MKQPLFYIDNDGHGYKVQYYANRIRNHLDKNIPIKSYWIKNLESSENKLDKIMIDSLFGAECKKKPKYYRMFITSLPDIPLKVRLKGDRSYVEINIRNKICKLQHITVNCSKPIAFTIPDIYSFTVVGIHKEVKIKQTFEVTSEMRAQMNLPRLLRYYLRQKMKSVI